MKQLDITNIEETINENIYYKDARKQIFLWFKNFLKQQTKRSLEKILIFITGTARIPLLQKIKVIKFIYIKVIYILTID